MYKAVTRGISVTVSRAYMPEESSPEDGRYFFAYTVEIVNTGPERVQLRSRYWKIIDEHGQIQEVRGAGVVGEAAGPRSGRELQLHERLPAADAERHHAGHYVMETDPASRRSFRRARDPALLRSTSPRPGRVVH